MIQKFIAYARSRAHVKDQKPFKRDLEMWFLQLPLEAKAKVTKIIQEGHKSPDTVWRPLANHMLYLFHKKAGG